MIPRLILLAFLLLPNLAGAQQLQQLYREAMDAYRNKDYPTFYTKIQEAHAIHPTHQGILYQAGIAAALTNYKAEAITFLRQAILINAEFHLKGVADFNSISQLPDFKKLLALQEECQRVISRSTLARTLTDRQLHPEGIDFDSRTGNFYLGGIHTRKIVRLAPDGTVSDFCPSGIEGMTSVMAIKVDAPHNQLWACSSPMQEMINYDSAAKSMIFRFELSSGKLLQNYSLTRNGVFGDMILDSKGNLYLSDGSTNEVLMLRKGAAFPTPFFSSIDFVNLQGMTFSPDEKFLFIADYVKGIFKLELATKKLSLITTSLPVALKGIDGLYFWKRSLIAIQNGVTPARVSRFQLDEKMTQITSVEVIDQNRPEFGEPTLGTIVEGQFYYLANSPWGAYNDQHQMKAPNQLKDVVILKFPLQSQ